MDYFFVKLQFSIFLIKHAKLLLTNADEETTIRKD